MIAQALAVLMLLAQPLAPVPSAPPPEQAAEPTQAEVFASIDTAMQAWKGKKADVLRGRLGLSKSTRAANDGEVVFWEHQLESTACGVDDSGAMRCGSIDGFLCRFGIAFDKEGKVSTWKPMGNAEACQYFLRAIGAPPK
jgi:hypothetical protein